jgi:hypothetical protein
MPASETISGLWIDVPICKKGIRIDGEQGVKSGVLFPKMPLDRWCEPTISQRVRKIKGKIGWLGWL